MHMPGLSVGSNVMSKVSLKDSQIPPVPPKREQPMSTGAKSAGITIDFKMLVKVPLFTLSDDDIRLMEAAITSIDSEISPSDEPRPLVSQGQLLSALESIMNPYSTTEETETIQMALNRYLLKIHRIFVLENVGRPYVILEE